MKVLTFLLTAQQPLLLTSLQGDPNSSVSFPYIPGSVIRGALIGHYIKRYCKDKPFEPSNEHVQRLFFSAHTRYLHAYLYAMYTAETPQRLLPMSRAWVKEKYKEFNRSSRDYDELSSCYERSSPNAVDVEEPQPVFDSTAYCWINRNTVSLYPVKQHINIHNQRDRKAGRGKSGSGTVFRYEAIAPWQTFQGVILLDESEHSDQDEKTLKELLVQERNMWVGGSRSAGYGHITITGEQTLDTWYEAGSTPASRLHINAPLENDRDEEYDEEDTSMSSVDTHHYELHVTLLSDMVVRNAYGQYNAVFPIEELAHHLGLTNQDVQAVPARSFIATTQHGGFNRVWGLPMPQTLALASGSVLVFTLPKPPAITDITKLEARGLGERRAEGFGRLVINWKPQTSATIFTLRRIRKPKPGQASPDTAEQSEDTSTRPADDEYIQLAQDMAQRIFRQRMEQHLTDLVERSTINPRDAISNTQLSRLRIIARRALFRLEQQQQVTVQQAMDDIHQLLETLTQNARNQFETAHIQKIPLMQWLKQRIDNPGKDWDNLTEPVKVADVTVSLDERLACIYTLRLMMAVAQHAVKQKEVV